MDASRPATLPGSRPGTVLVPQGLLTRGPAFLLDTLLVSTFVGLLLGRQTGLMQLVMVSLAAEFVYFSLLEGLLGTTLGKRFVGLRVVRASDGRRCGPGAAVVRTTLRLVDNLLFSLPGMTAIISSPRRQRFGDRAARTLVVAEVPEQVLFSMGNAAHAGPVSPDEVLKRFAEQLQQQTGVAVDVDSFQEFPPMRDVVTCPFCAEPMDPDEIVCRDCGHYVNQVTANAEADDRAPMPMLYSEDRRYRFDALWRLVFADDEESRAAVCTAVATWSRADRLLAVHTFAEVSDRRPIAFLEFLTHDPDPAVCALAQDTRWRLGGL